MTILPGGNVASVSGGIETPTPALQAQPVDTRRVSEWLLQYVDGCKKRAETVSKPDIWDCVDAANNAYGQFKKSIDPQEAGIRAASYGENSPVRTEDLADQVDEMTALIDNLTKSGPIRRLVAKAGIPKSQAELTASVQDSLLSEKDWDAEKRTFVGRFVKHPLAGLKVCRACETSYITERIEVPVAPLYTDEALMMRGFSPEDIESGHALGSVLAEYNLQFVGIADEKPDGSYTAILCTSCRPIKRDYVYIKAVDARRLAFSDMFRPCATQHSIHEFHYLTFTELQKGYFRNLDKLKKEGKQITSSNRQNPGSDTTSGRANSSLMETPVYEVVESWLEIPWQDGIDENKFTDDEYRAFAIEQEFPPAEGRYASQKWCVFHTGGNLLLKIYPNYLKTKDEFPYDMESFIYGDGNLRGQGMMERLSNVSANLSTVLNLTIENMKRNLYTPMLVRENVGMSDEDIKRFQKNGGFARVSGMFQPDDSIMTFQVPDLSNLGFKGIGYFEDKLRGLGVPAVLAGEGSADTATQETINNRRGQTIVNEAFGRMVRVFMSSYRKHLEVMVNTFTTARYIDMAGERGATMTREWVTPREITDKLEIEPLISFNDGDKQRMSTLFMGMMNIVAGLPDPEAPKNVKALLKLVLQYNNVPESDIETIMGDAGSLTNVQQEIETLLQDPNATVEIRMDDNHPLCIQQAQMTLMQLEQEAMGMGMPFMPPQNLIDYMQVHMAMLQQQQLQLQMQMMAAGGPEQPQGKPVQGRSDGGPQSEVGGAKQDGQANGKGNKGPESAAGLTGQNSPAALVPGSPAGI